MHAGGELHTPDTGEQTNLTQTRRRYARANPLARARSDARAQARESLFDTWCAAHEDVDRNVTRCVARQRRYGKLGRDAALASTRDIGPYGLTVGLTRWAPRLSLGEILRANHRDAEQERHEKAQTHTRVWEVGSSDGAPVVAGAAT